MTTIPAPTLRADVLAFAEAYPTPNVRRLVALCEAGRITWGDAYELSRKALAAGIADRDARGGAR